MFICLGSGYGSSVFSIYRDTAVSNNAPEADIAFNPIAIGDAEENRLVVIFIAWKGTLSGDITNVSCNTVAMTQNAKDYYATNSDGCAIYSLNVGTGTTATIEAQFSGGVDEARISIYTIYGLNSLTPEDTGSSATHSGSNPTTTLTHSVGSFCIVGTLWSGATACSLTIGGVTVAEDYESDGLPDSSSSTVGSMLMSSSANEATATANIGLSNTKYLVAASWR